MSDKLFTEDESDEILLVREKRRSILKKLTEKGLPNDNEDMDLILSVLGAMEKSSLETAKLRLRDKSDAKMGVNNALLAEVLLHTKPSEHRLPPSQQDHGFQLTVPVDLQLVEGETDITIEPLTLEDLK